MSWEAKWSNRIYEWETKSEKGRIWGVNEGKLRTGTPSLFKKEKKKNFVWSKEERGLLNTNFSVTKKGRQGGGRRGLNKLSRTRGTTATVGGGGLNPETKGRTCGREMEGSEVCAWGHKKDQHLSHGQGSGDRVITQK